MLLQGQYQQVTPPGRVKMVVCEFDTPPTLRWRVQFTTRPTAAAQPGAVKMSGRLLGKKV